MTDFVGGSGDDSITGTADADAFDLSQGGDDTAIGAGGNDVFNMGGAFTSNDRILGGDGFDTVVLDGDYSAGVNISFGSVRQVERITFEAGHDYEVRVGGGLTTSVDYQSHLSADDHLTLYGSQLSGSAGLLYEGGVGHETIIGSAQTDSLYLLGGLAADDRIDGGEGADYLRLEGDYSAGLVMTNQTLRNVENLWLHQGDSYDLTFAKATVDAEGLWVYAPDLTHADSLHIDASKATAGAVTIDSGGGNDELIGGNRDDQLSGGKGIDRLTGGEGSDQMSGGDGNDRFMFNHASDSTAEASDLITDLTSGDVINLKHLDADLTSDGNQSFHLVGAFGGHAGELTLSYEAGSDVTSILGDVDGDGQADLVIHASGDQTGFSGLVL